ncbi:MAG: hypothetical protein AB1593_08935 [Pseudomonadota bacterium]
MAKEKDLDDRKPLHEQIVPLRKSDPDSVPLSEGPSRRIFDVTDTRPPPENPHRGTKEDGKK